MGEKLSKESIRKLKAIKKAILAEPEMYDQSEFPRFGDTCGTPCCFAGWAVWVNHPDPKAYEQRLKTVGMFASHTLQTELGVSYTQASRLFSGWHAKKYKAAWEKPGTKEAAKAGADYIDDFIAANS